ncbi:MAG: hypothetical protein RJA57_51 [Bacteroidota bacterium]
MSGHHPLEQLWHDAAAIYLENLRLLRKRIRPGNVHAFRVAVKKLRACITWLGEKNTPLNKSFQPILAFYKESGRYRDADVGLKWLRRFGERKEVVQSAFTEQLTEQRQLARDAMKRQLEKDSLEGAWTETDQLLRMILADMTAKKIRALIRRSIRKHFSEAARSSSRFRRNAHTIRKKLKRAYVALGILPDPVPYDEPAIRQLGEGLNALGDAHDLHLLRNRIRDYRNEHDLNHQTDKRMLYRLEKAAGKRLDRRLLEAKKKLLPLLKDLRGSSCRC